MDPHPMDHMPPSLMPTIPNILSSAYASRLDWIRNRGVRPAPPTPPPVVTPSGEPGPGSRAERPWEFAPVAPAAPVVAGSVEEAERLGVTTVSFTNKWQWPTDRVPKNGQEREEKAAYDSGLDETTRALPGQNVDEMRKLLQQCEDAVGSSELTNAQNAQVQGMIDALRKWLAQPQQASAPVQAPTAAAAPTVVRTWMGGKLGHKMEWPNIQPPMKDDRKIAAFLRNLGYQGRLVGGAFEYLKFARAVWNAHAAGNAFLADDLLADAMANSDPNLASVLKMIEEFARAAEPETVAAKAYEGRPKR